jgi:hypothetical protein
MVVNTPGGNVVENGGKESKTGGGEGEVQVMEQPQPGEVVQGEGGEQSSSASSSSSSSSNAPNLGISTESGITETEERSMSPEQQRGLQPSPSSIAKGEDVSVGERNVGEKSHFLEEGEGAGEGGDGGSGKKGTKKAKTSGEEVSGGDVGKRSTRSGKPVTA